MGWSRSSWMLMGLLAAASGVSAQMQPPADPLDYALFALEAVTLGPSARVGGAVGVNDGVAKLRRGARVDAVVAADVIHLGRKTSVGGLVCTLVVGGSGECDLHSGPLVPQSALAVVQATAGLSDVIVPARARRVPLPAAPYRHIRVGRGSTLLLEGGNYEAQSVTLAPRAAMSCMSPCRIAVARALKIGRRASLDGADETVAVRVDVQGERTRAGIRVGAGAGVGAVLYAPTADAKLGRRAQVSGSVVARSVRTGGRVRVERP